VDAAAPDALVRGELVRLCLALLELEGRVVPDGGCDADRLAEVLASGREKAPAPEEIRKRGPLSSPAMRRDQLTR